MSGPRINVDTSHVIAAPAAAGPCVAALPRTVLLTAAVALALTLSAQPWSTWTSTPPAATPTATPTVSASPVATVSTVRPPATYWHSRTETEVGGVLVESSESWTGTGVRGSRCATATCRRRR